MNSHSPIKLSVLMLAYNHQEYISDAIESIVCQCTKYKFELLVGEDQSTDNTLSIAHQYASKYPHIVRVLPSERKYGLGENLRRLIANSSSEYIAFCEGDDLWIGTDRIDLQVELLSQSEDVSFVYGDFDRISYCEGEWRLLRHSCQHSGKRLRDGFILEDLMDRIDIHLSTVMCKSHLLKEYIDSPMFDSSLWLGDVPMFLYLSSKGRALSVPHSLSIYRHHSESITQSSSSSRLRVVLDHVKAVRFCEIFFASPPERRKRRNRILRKMVAEVAYSDRNMYYFVANAELQLSSFLRLLLMTIGPFHSFWMNRARKIALLDFISNSQPFQSPNNSLD